MYFRISLSLCFFAVSIAFLDTAAAEESSSSSTSEPPSLPQINLCHLQAVTGNCKGIFRRWYFNTNTTTCEQFVYGGCKGNANNFQSKDECVKQCYPLEVCHLTAEPGLCDGNFPRWYFDTTTKKCTQFVYGGCGGNGNNFETEGECNKICSDSTPKTSS